MKTKIIQFVRYQNETNEQALAALVQGTKITAKLVREVGDAGHPEAELTGETEELNGLLRSLGYLLDEDPTYPLKEEGEDWKAPGAMREWTYTVPYTVVKHKTVTVIADREPQATSNMLAAMLDAGLEVQTGWKLESTRTLASAGDETKLMRPITVKGYND